MALKDATTVESRWISTFFYRQDDLASQPQFAGLFGDSIVTSLEKNFGDFEAVVSKNPATGRFEIVRKIRGAPDLPEIQFTERIKINTRSMLERIAKTLCDHVFIVKIDDCGRPDDLNSWTSLWLVIGAGITSLSPGELQQFDESQLIEQEGTLAFLNFERLFTVQFGEKADSIVLAEVIDIIYADEQSCGACAPFSSGCQAVYALTVANSGSPGLSSQVVYTTDGDTYATRDISTLGGLSGSELNSVGNYIVVVSEADGAHHYILRANIATDAWTRVATGYVGGGSPRVIWAKSPTQVYIGGQNGYLYESTDITAGVSVIEDGSLSTERTNAIHAIDSYILSGHDNNVLKFSENEGATFSLITGPSVGVNVESVWIRNKTQWWVGMADGTLYYTGDSGASWTQRLLPDQSSITALWDIKFSPDFDEIGAVSIQKGTTGEVYRTFTGGRTWMRTTPGIIQLNPLPERFKKIALCGTDDIAAGGKKQSSTDGVIGVAAGGGVL